MATFHLQVVTLDGLSFNGEAEKLIVRTIDGDLCILPRHIDYITALGMGEARIYTGGEIRRAACIGGLMSVANNEVRLVPTTFEWAEDIDAERAERAREAAEQILRDKTRSKQDLSVAEARLKRALVRKSVSHM